MKYADRECNKTHFIVLAHPRSGSTMLSSALATHSQVVMYGEVFNDDAHTRQHDFPGDLRKKRQNGGFSVTRRADPYHPNRVAADFLSHSVFYPRWRIAPMAIGIKIFYDHARATPPERRAWDFLQTSDHLRVIHLQRENLLHAYLSLQKALATNQWTSADKASNTKPLRIRVSIEDCLKCLDTI